MKRRWAIVSVLGFLVIAAPAHASFPGTQGKIAFESNRVAGQGVYGMTSTGASQAQLVPSADTASWSADGAKIAFYDDATGFISSANADGTNVQGICFCLSGSLEGLGWSPDRTRIVYADAVPCGTCTDTADIWTVSADGSTVTQLTNTPSDDEAWPDWSPDGSKIAFSKNGRIATMNPDGTGVTLLPGALGTLPSWSPDGRRIAYTGSDGDSEVYKVNADGTGQVQLTQNTANDNFPAWSPDGSKIAFTSDRDGNREIYSMGFDGTNQLRLTTDAGSDAKPDWQPVPFTGYARPKGATPMRLPLVPAYNACVAPNGSHGAPLAFPSCKPPVQGSSYLTLGTFDANGAQASSLGFFYFNVLVGVPGPPVDTSFNAGMTITDVRCSATPSACGSANDAAGADYIGELEAAVTLRITDKKNGPGLNEPATMTDYTLSWPVACGATSSTSVGSTCSFPLTCMDAFVPGLSPEGTRDVWELVKAEVYDGGSDGDGDTTADNTLFARPGLFVP